MHAFPGRPREFTHKKREELINHIAQGATIEQAARIMGVSLRTIQREAKHNDCFHHDLELALHAAPADPRSLVERAARTHWRAAAWLLERSDPDRFAKRPPNSCSPEKLQDIMAFLIETALEATPPDAREAVYGRMREAADRAFDALMPDQHEARRWTDALATRPMPLSSAEFRKQLGDPEWNRQAQARHIDNNPALKLQRWLHAQTPPPAASALLPAEAAGMAAALCPPEAPPQWRPSYGFKRQDSSEMDAVWRFPTPEEEDAWADAADARADARAAARDAREAAARKKRERSDAARKEQESLREQRRKALHARFAMRPLQSEAPSAPASNPAPPPPPDGGIMSPEMSATTKLDAPPAYPGRASNVRDDARTPSAEIPPTRPEYPAALEAARPTPAGTAPATSRR